MSDVSSTKRAQTPTHVPHCKQTQKKFSFTRFKHLGGWNLTDDGFKIDVADPKSTLEFQASSRKSSNIIELLSAYYLFLLTADSSELPLNKFDSLSLLNSLLPFVVIWRFHL